MAKFHFSLSFDCTSWLLPAQKTKVSPLQSHAKECFSASRVASKEAATQGRVSEAAPRGKHPASLFSYLEQGSTLLDGKCSDSESRSLGHASF